MLRPARITSSTSNNCDAITGLQESNKLLFDKEEAELDVLIKQRELNLP